VELVDTAVSSAVASRHAGSSPAERRENEKKRQEEKRKKEDGSIANKKKSERQQWSARGPMHSSETIETSGRKCGKGSGGLRDEASSRNELEARRLGEWGEGDREKRKTTTRGKMDSTRCEWESLVEQERRTDWNPSECRASGGIATKRVWKIGVQIGIGGVRRGVRVKTEDEGARCLCRRGGKKRFVHVLVHMGVCG
jgi:hypothetical protein